MAKIAHIIPGFTEDTSMPGYQAIIPELKQKGYRVEEVNIDWKYKVMSDYVEQFKSRINHKPEDEVLVLGYSFGAMIAFLSAEFTKPNLLFLCSLSPFFSEDLDMLFPSWVRDIGKNRIKNLKALSFNNGIKNVKCKTILVAGEKEVKQIFDRANDALKKISNSELIIAPDIGHELNKSKYYNKVIEIIRDL